MSRMQDVQLAVAAIAKPTLSPNVSEQKRLPTAYPQQQSRARTEAAIAEQQRWDAYRKWLSRVATPPAAERPRLDRSIYSWRGYHTWADKVRRSWNDGKA